MQRLIPLTVAVFFFIFTSIGCSGGSGVSPLDPGIDPGTGLTGLTGATERSLEESSNHVLWGFWQVVIDQSTLEFEVVPLRGVTFHINTSRLLEQSPVGLSLHVNSLNIADRLLDVDVTITHPVPNSNLRGFDVRGILMGPGATVTSQTDPGIIFNALDGTRLLNADGYTRWWNAIEFTTSGIFGYDHNQVIPGFLVPETTLNPYKYFADPLGPDDPVVPYVNQANRGTFSTDLAPPSVTRNYQVQFPVIGGQPKLGFHYAIDASYAPPTGDSPSPKPIEDFPPGANCPEPFHINVSTEESNVWYVNSGSNGGDLVLDIEVFDWGASDNPEGILGEINLICIESQTLFEPVYLSQFTAAAGTEPSSGLFHVVIPDCHPTDVFGQEILVTVKSKWPDSYSPPFGTQDYPEAAALAAYTLVEIPVSAIEPSFVSITLESPNGGETWPISSEQTIEWVSNEVEFVDIDLSLDAGISFPISVADDAPDTGKYTIESVGDWSSEHARIRVSTSDGSLYDESDADFTVKPMIFVDMPNGDEVLLAGTAAVIKWTASDTIENVGILLSIDTEPNFIHDFIPQGDKPVPNTGEYSWAYISPDFITSTARLKIFDLDNPSVYGTSDGIFTILPESDADITVLSPNGGEEFAVGNPAEITWGAIASIENIKIELSIDGGANFDYLISGSVPNDGNFTIDAIPYDAASNNCLVKISYPEDGSVFDVSDDIFTILDESITIESPFTGSQWHYNSPALVIWSWTGNPSSIDIDLSIDGGTNFDIPLAVDEENDGEFGLTVGDWTSSEAVVRISTDHGDYLSGEFAIRPAITLISPNGGEFFMTSDPMEITWESSTSIAAIGIMLGLDGGQSYLIPIAPSVQNDGQHIIPSIPEEYIGAYCRIKIFDTSNTSVYDISDGDFTIYPQPPPNISVISPNGGESWAQETSHVITWEAIPQITDVKIELSNNGGISYNEVIVESTPNTGSFVWEAISQPAGTLYMVRISDIDEPVDRDQSDSPFSIALPSPPSISLILPNGSESVRIGAPATITWGYTGNIPKVDVKLIVDDILEYDLAIEYDNVGSFPITELSWINTCLADLTLPETWWTYASGTKQAGSPVLDAKITVHPCGMECADATSADYFYFPITLGVLDAMMSDSTALDSDFDLIPDDVEIFIGSEPESRDTDMDWPTDYDEIFGSGFTFDDGWDPTDWIANFNYDDYCAFKDPDDNGDGILDGDMLDTDLDGIPNYLEYYGYTYDWVSGKYYLWDKDYGLTYYKTDPMQPSTDQDPYPDGMEVSGAFMDVSVEEPGDFPMVPAYPNIVVRLEGYEVTLNQTITTTAGEQYSEGSTWTQQTSRTNSHTHTREHNWEVGASVEFGNFSNFWLPKVNIHANYGGSDSNSDTNSTTSTQSNGQSIMSTEDWSRATSANPTDAAHIKLYLKVYNIGTACASNIIPTLNLKIGGMNIATFEPGNSQINTLVPGGVYPAGTGTFWVIDSIDTGVGVTPIALTMNELRALESRCPVSVVMTQMMADVMLMNQSGQWESAGQWGEYMARCEAACSNMYLELGNGDFIHYLIYSDDSPTSPEVNFGDAMFWVAGADGDTEDFWITYRDRFGQVETASLDDWDFALDPDTLTANEWTVPAFGSGSGPEYPVSTYVADLVLNPDSIIIGKIPRDDLPADSGPVVYYANLDEECDVVRVAADDYYGIAKAEFTYDSKATTVVWNEMDEVIAFSGLFSFPITSSYVYTGDEKVRVTSNDGTVSDEIDVLKVEYPEEVVPTAPTISEVNLDFRTRRISAKVTFDEQFPVVWVRAFHTAFLPDGYIEMEPYSDFWQHPDEYYCDLPCPFGLTNITVVAAVSSSVYTDHLVVDPDEVTRPYRETGGNITNQFDWTDTDEYEAGIIDFDKIWGDNCWGWIWRKWEEDDWKDSWLDEFRPSMDIYIRFNDEHPTSQRWLLYFDNGQNYELLKSGSLECVTLQDIQPVQPFTNHEPISLWGEDSDDRIFNAFGNIYVMNTDGGRITAFQITSLSWYDCGGDCRGLTMHLDWKTF